MKLFRQINHIAITVVICLIVFSIVSDPTTAGSVMGYDHPQESQVSDLDNAEESTPGFVGNLVTLGLLILLQAVLGFDNLLYISLESKHAPPESQSSVRAWGIGLAIFLRIGLLYLLVSLQGVFETIRVFEINLPLVEGNFNIHSLIVLAGGTFIIYTAMKEIWHMTRLEHAHHDEGKRRKKSVVAVVFWIMVMNIVFSFDSILSAIALTDVVWVMALAIVVSGLLMIWLSDRVANFLARNRMYEVLGLFVLFVVGIMLVTEGGHLAHLTLWGNEVQPMTKTTFYFVLAILVLTDIVQSRYQKKILAESKMSGMPVEKI